MIEYQFSDVGYMDQKGLCPVHVRDKLSEEQKESEVSKGRAEGNWTLMELMIGTKEKDK